METSIIRIVLTATWELPVVELTVLLSILTICLLLRVTRIGLITAYLFVYRWGWAFMSGQSDRFLASYLAFGIIVGTITAIGMFHAPTSD